MSRYSFKRGLQAALCCQQRNCKAWLRWQTRSEEILVSESIFSFPGRRLSGITESCFFHGNVSACRKKLNRLSPQSPRFHRGFDGCHGTFCEYRLYCTDSRRLQHFRRRGFDENRWRPQQIVLIVVGTTGLCASVYFSNRETVPYTFRNHFVLIPPKIENQLVESQFQALKEQWRPFILPAFHPDSIRVRRIAKDIIQAVIEGTQLDDFQAIEIQNEGHVRNLKEGDFDAVFRQHDANDLSSTKWGDREERFDDQWMNKSRKKGLKSKSQPSVEHLQNTKWEVLVVNKDVVNAFCLPGGKIVVFTGLLRRFSSDNEIATVLGHEIGHVVARHSAERMTRHLFLTLVQLVVLAFVYAPDLVQSMSTLFLELPFSRSQELEADHIGLLLMAAAGYDPRAAPHVYEKLDETAKSSEILQYITTHPSGKKRGERLRRTGTMEEALRIYEGRNQGTVIEGFLRAF